MPRRAMASRLRSLSCGEKRTPPASGGLVRVGVRVRVRTPPPSAGLARVRVRVRATRAERRRGVLSEHGRAAASNAWDG
eukprot:scaffold45031_cov33-Phaeocystis_antarctica.AAC.1